MSDNNQSSQKEKVDEAKWYHYSSPVSSTDHLVIAHRVYPKNYNDCLNDELYTDQSLRCACRLGLSGDDRDLEICKNGYDFARKNFAGDKLPAKNLHTFDQLRSCLDNMPSDETQEKWLIGCVNYLRK